MPEQGFSGQNFAAGKVLLVTGGCRSGKSEFAENIFSCCAGLVVYVATALPTEAMRSRIAAHQTRRNPGWVTREEAHRPDLLLRRLICSDLEMEGVLLDSVTSWLSNRILADVPRARMEREVRFLAAMSRKLSIKKQCRVALVTDEVGCGVAPATRMGNDFRDILGGANQYLAQKANDVVLVVSGLPLLLKGRLP